MKRVALVLAALALLLLLAGCAAPAEIRTSFPTVTAAPTVRPAEPPILRTMPAPEPETSGVTYVLNKNTKKFHYPDCASVDDMAAKNRLDVSWDRDEVIARGYVPCKRCNP